MRILLHICCGPCAIMPIQLLARAGHELIGFFHNPNIHPTQEYLRRLEGARAVAERLAIPLEVSPVYAPDDWMRMTCPHASTPQTRCPLCWKERLDQTARQAAAGDFDAFTTSLLYSRRQRHEEIAALAHDIAARRHTVFLYQDFRPHWQAGITLSKEWQVHRQQYCGCLYSEHDRYRRDLAKSI